LFYINVKNIYSTINADLAQRILEKLHQPAPMGRTGVNKRLGMSAALYPPK
jgi:hypothetical protein